MPKHQTAIRGSEPPMLTAALLDGEGQCKIASVGSSATDGVKIAKNIRRLLALLVKLDITTEDLEAHGIDLEALANILALPWYARAERWLVYDETILKILLWPLLHERNIRSMTRGSIFKEALSDLVELKETSEDLGRVQAEESPLEEQALIPTIRSKKICASPKKWFNAHFYPQANSFLFSRAKALKKVFFVDGLVRGTETVTMRVWSLLLLSFMAIDLYYYYAYPDDRYGQTLIKIFFSSSDNEVGLSAALTYSTVWPELLGVPILWGMFKGIRQVIVAKGLTLKARAKLLRALQHYHSRGWRDCGIWLLPCHSLQAKLKQAELLLLWNGNLTKDESEELFVAIQEIALHATKFTQLHALAILGALADYPGPKDLLKLHQQNTAKDPLLYQIALKERAFAELKKHALAYQPEEEAQRGKNRLTRALVPLPRYLYANYLLWCLGKPESKLLQPLFWSYKAFIFYLKGRLLWAIGNGIRILVKRYLDKLDCERQGKLWIWMSRVGDYKCTVCGDLSISYKYIFTIENCANAYFHIQRTEDEIISFFKKYDKHLRSLRSFDLSHQILESTSFNKVLNELCSTIPHVDLLLLNISKSICMSNYLTIGIGHGLEKVITLPDLRYIDFTCRNLSATAIMVIGQKLPESSIQTLNLTSNRIGNIEISALAVELPQSQLRELDLSSNNIGPEGAKELAAILPQSQLRELDLYRNSIGDEGIKGLAAFLNQSLLQILELRGNNIGDKGVKALAAVLAQSQLQILELGGNNIGDEGVKALAAVLAQSQLQELDLWGNIMGAEGIEAIATILSSSSLKVLRLGYNEYFGDAATEVLAVGLAHSQVQILHLSGSNIGDKGAKALATVLPQSSLLELFLWNNVIGELGIKALAAALPDSQLQALYIGDIERIIKINISTLALALPQSQISFLDLGYDIDVEGAKNLAAIFPQSRLQYLYLQKCNIGTEGARALAAVLPQSNLQGLYIEDDNIEAEGAKAIANALSQSWLQELYLGGTSIGDEGIKALASTLPHSQLQTLNLGWFNTEPLGNNISNQGIEALASVLTTYQPHRNLWIYELNWDQNARALDQAEPNTDLQSLSLAYNRISDSGAIKLCKYLPNTGITNLDLSNNPIRDPNLFYCASDAFAPSLPLPIRFLIRSCRLTMDYMRSFVGTAFELPSASYSENSAMVVPTVKIQFAAVIKNPLDAGNASEISRFECLPEKGAFGERDISVSEIFTAQVNTPSSFSAADVCTASIATPFYAANSSITLFGSSPLAIATEATPALPASFSESTAATESIPNLSPFLFLLGGAVSCFIAVLGSAAKPAYSATTRFFGSFFAPSAKQNLPQFHDGVNDYMPMADKIIAT